MKLNEVVIADGPASAIAATRFRIGDLVRITEITATPTFANSVTFIVEVTGVEKEKPNGPNETS